MQLSPLSFERILRLSEMDAYKDRLRGLIEFVHNVYSRTSREMESPKRSAR